jgi:hypothetical protein
MATIKEVAPAPWRIQFSGIPASFSGVQYHVEQQARTGGRRIVLHEYPKRDNPYSEDMGRAATRYQITGYLIGPSYHIQKRALISVLENRQGGELIDPYLAQPIQAVCERYSVTETRERGGYCVFDMAFIEAGSPGNTPDIFSTMSQLQNGASNMGIRVSLNVDIPNIASVSIAAGIGHA